MDAGAPARELGEFQTVTFKTLGAAGSSALAGTVIGAITAAWQDVPPVERNKALPALLKTGRMMGCFGILFGVIGGTFALVDAMSESYRGKSDFVNGILGGFAAGSILGLKARKFPVGFGAGAAMAGVSAVLDAGGQRKRAATGKEYLPYSLPCSRESTDGEERRMDGCGCR